MNFTYMIISNKDNSYGNELKNGSWNGMIGRMFKKDFLSLSNIMVEYYYPYIQNILFS